MKAYRLEVFVIDFDDIGIDAIRFELENARFGNRCIEPEVKGVEERDIGEWGDDHPLNMIETADEEYERLFRREQNKGVVP